jgi:hypothetical protein
VRSAPASDAPAPTADAIEAWTSVLDVLDATAHAHGSADEPSPAAADLEQLAGSTLGELPPELEARARAVLARLEEASSAVMRQMGELRAEMTAPRSPRVSSVPPPHRLDLQA